MRFHSFYLNVFCAVALISHLCVTTFFSFFFSVVCLFSSKRSFLSLSLFLPFQKRKRMNERLENCSCFFVRSSVRRNIETFHEQYLRLFFFKNGIFFF